MRFPRRDAPLVMSWIRVSEFETVMADVATLATVRSAPSFAPPVTRHFCPLVHPSSRKDPLALVMVLAIWSNVSDTPVVNTQDWSGVDISPPRIVTSSQSLSQMSAGYSCFPSPVKLTTETLMQ